MRRTTKATEGNPSTSGEARTRERKAARSGLILREAEALFIEHGFDAVSMDMVAQTSGMSKVTVYKYFPSKDELLTAVILAFVDRTNRRIWPLDATDRDMRSVLRAVATNFYEVFLTESVVAFRRLVLGVLPRFPDLGRRVFDEGPAVILGKLADYFKAETAKGNADVVDPELAAVLFHGLVVNDMDMRGVYLFEAPSKADVAKRVDVAVEMFASYYVRP